MKVLKGFLVVDTNLQYPIWAIKRRDTDVESPVNEFGHPGFDHAIWYWWRLECGWNRYSKVTFESAMNRLEFHNQSVYNRNSYNYDHSYKVLWDRVSDNTWRVLVEKYGNRIAIATLVRLDRIENPESTYRWYRE